MSMASSPLETCGGGVAGASIGSSSVRSTNSCGGRRGPPWAPLRPYRGVGPALWRVLDEETWSGGVEAPTTRVEGGDKGGVEGRLGREALLGPPV